MARGKFIVFEGIDGCGKGTQAILACNYIFNKDKRNDVLLTREPTRENQQIRNKMSQENDVKKDAEWYADLFIQDRKLHISTHINYLIEKGTDIVCDRYKYSTLAYQHTQGIDLNSLIERHENMIIPDLIFIFDCSAEIAFERRKNEGATDVFDKDLGFQEKLRNNYLLLKEKLPYENIIIIDSSKSIQEIHGIVKKNIDKLMENRYE